MEQTHIAYPHTFVVMNLELIFLGWEFFSWFFKKKLIELLWKNRLKIF